MRDLTTRVFLVAEIGNNHEGDAERAGRMVEEAARCGVDAVKFQTYRTERFIGSEDPARFARMKRFELGGDRLAPIAARARALGLRFLSTPLDLESAAELEPIVDAFKIASGDNDFVPLLEQVSRTEKPLVVSTGASDLATVDRAVETIRRIRAGRDAGPDLALLHCVSAYPAPAEEANLLAIPYLAERFPDLPVGYSDHVLGSEACLTAAALGARILEKHFTLDKNLSDFRDHGLSADPGELRTLVRSVRRIESMRGRAEKTPLPCEEPILQAIRRSIVAASDLSAGHAIEPTDLAWLRPGGGLPPGRESELLGKRLNRPLRRGERITARDVA